MVLGEGGGLLNHLGGGGGGLGFKPLVSTLITLKIHLTMKVCTFIPLFEYICIYLLYEHVI